MSYSLNPLEPARIVDAPLDRGSFETAEVLPRTRNEILVQKLNQRAIPSLDGIRAIAALLVVGLHGAYNFIPGRLGVLVFFVLSGFLITRLLLIEEDKTGTVSLKIFYERRAFRIFPAFYAYAIAVTLYLLPTPPWAKLATCYLYISNYALVWMRPDFPMPGSWSLSVEEQFYLLWPASFRAMVKRGKNVVAILVTIIVAVQIWKVMLFFAHVDGEYLHSASDTRCSDLLVGCVLAILTHRKFRIPEFLLHPAATVAPLAVFLLAAYLDAVGRHEVAIAFFYTPAAIATAVLMLQCIALSDRHPFSWLDWNWVRYLGRTSYSLYLWHGFAIAAVVAMGPMKYRWHIVLVFALAIIFASLSYHCIERPFLRLRARLTEK